MDFCAQYFDPSGIIVKAPPYIDNFFIKDFVEQYKRLLAEKAVAGTEFLEEPKKFTVIFPIEDEESGGEDFDLVFISYLVLLKLDFPNLEIGIYFPDFEEGSIHAAPFYQFAQHRQHLFINGKTDFFKLYKGRKEYHSDLIFQSSSYLPPLIITPAFTERLFKRKKPARNRKHIIEKVAGISMVKGFESTEREAIFSNFKNQYALLKGNPVNWQFDDLSTLYLIKMLYDLYLLRYIIDGQKGVESNYRVGQSIVKSKDDPDGPDIYRADVMRTLTENEVFSMSDVEIYMLFMLLQHNDIFKIPPSLQAMLVSIKPFLNHKEAEAIAQNTAAVRKKFIAIFADNLVRIINYAKDLAYSLEELAKNIVEHTYGKYGIITGRMYQFKRINNLKSIEDSWANKFKNHQKFLDLNVIDTGLKSIIHSYGASLMQEKEEWDKNTATQQVKQIVSEGYRDDIEEIKKYKLINFFNFNSIKLYHQINRVKARLGLLIFSQNILKEKKALAHISSNSLSDITPTGFYLFDREDGVIAHPSDSFFPLGTNYNFIIPLEEKFIYKKPIIQGKQIENSVSASVFLELHDYQLNGAEKYNLKKIKINQSEAPINKYQKIDFIKRQVGDCAAGVIPLINAQDLNGILSNSSDWVRFLANMQFGANYVHDMIVYGIDPDLYAEIISILKLFDQFLLKDLGFWKQDRYILFFLPVSHNGTLFWFNNLLTSSRYKEYLKINEEIALYHLNLSVITDERPLDADVVAPKQESLFYSSGGKLLNFELLIENEGGLTLFEETIKSLVNIEIIG